MQPIDHHDQRTDFRVEIDILLNKYVEGRPHLARASNISRRGLLLHRLFEPRNKQDAVGLQFQLPGTHKVITCAGRVVYTHPWLEAQGVEFTHIEPEHQRLIDDYLIGQLRWP